MCCGQYFNQLEIINGIRFNGKEYVAVDFQEIRRDNKFINFPAKCLSTSDESVYEANDMSIVSPATYNNFVIAIIIFIFIFLIRYIDVSSYERFKII